MVQTSHPQHIVITQGHRNTSGGNPDESARTPRIANAVTAALSAAGHHVECLQNTDGAADNWFAGSLDAVGRGIMAIHAERPVDIMLDIHLEGDAAGTRGVFAIVPDGDGLNTLTRYAGSDAMAGNTLDHALARAIARRISEATGLPLRVGGCVEPGVMSEKATYVGASLGWRLAMFGYTAPARERMVRLVVECGNVVSDRDRIDGGTFADQVGSAIAHAVEEVYAGPGGVPLPPVIEPLFPPFATVATLQSPRKVTVTVDALNARQWAELGARVNGVWERGRQFWVRGWVIGDDVDGNPVWWITGKRLKSDLQWRVWSGGTDLAGHAILALPRT